MFVAVTTASFVYLCNSNNAALVPFAKSVAQFESCSAQLWYLYQCVRA